VPGNRYLPVAVCDIASPFDAICQELGHAYGFEHSFDDWGTEYGDPYDAMAAQFYGGVYTSVSFERPSVPAFTPLPVGVSDGTDPQKTIGPYISAAQIALSGYAPRLKAAGMVVDVPASFTTSASSFTLYALDYAIDRYPGQPLPMVAVIPPRPGGETYFLELRRKAGYDSGLRSNTLDTASPPVGLVIHSYNALTKQIRYVDTLTLADGSGDRDYHNFKRNFIVRVNRIGKDYQSVGLMVSSGDLWRNFGINLESVEHDIVAQTQSPVQKAEVSPCFMFPVGEYYYHYEYSFNLYTVIVSSLGYEKPGYTWTVNGILLDPAKNKANIPTTVKTPGPAGTSSINKPVEISYTIAKDRLSLSSNPELGNFSLVVEVKSSETSPEVLKNLYEDRSMVTSIKFDNVALRWDENYQNKQKACQDAIDAVNKKRTPRRKLGIPDPGDPFRERFFRVFIYQAVAVTLETIASVGDALAETARIISRQNTNRR
jgi:hypothetical protein